MGIFRNIDFITDMHDGLNTEVALSTINAWFETGLYFYFVEDNCPSILNKSYKRSDKIKFISDGRYIEDNTEHIITYNVISDSLVVHGFYYKKKKQYFPVIIVAKHNDVVVVIEMSIENNSAEMRLVGKARMYELKDNGSLKYTAYIAPIYNSGEPAYHIKINNFTNEDVEIIMKNKNNYLYTATTGNINNENEYLYRHQCKNGVIQNMELLSVNTEKVIPNCDKSNEFTILCKLHDINFKNHTDSEHINAMMSIVDSHLNVNAVVIK